jgi:hypothetical protein
MFPTSIKTSDLANPFRTNFEAFLTAMKASGMTIKITATLRPKQRAYLMHYSWMIAKGKIAPADVPPMIGVDIIWNHNHAKQGAQEMVDGYGINNLGVPPSLTSRHIEGRAVDTVLSWNGDIHVKQRDGTPIAIISEPRNSTHPALIAVGATYGVIHLKPAFADKVHWSDDGH